MDKILTVQQQINWLAISGLSDGAIVRRVDELGVRVSQPHVWRLRHGLSANPGLQLRRAIASAYRSRGPALPVNMWAMALIGSPESRAEVVARYFCCFGASQQVGFAEFHYPANHRYWRNAYYCLELSATRTDGTIPIITPPGVAYGRQADQCPVQK